MANETIKRREFLKLTGLGLMAATLRPNQMGSLTNFETQRAEEPVDWGITALEKLGVEPIGKCTRIDMYGTDRIEREIGLWKVPEVRGFEHNDTYLVSSIIRGSQDGQWKYGSVDGTTAVFVPKGMKLDSTSGKGHPVDLNFNGAHLGAEVNEYGRLEMKRTKLFAGKQELKTIDVTAFYEEAQIYNMGKLPYGGKYIYDAFPYISGCDAIVFTEEGLKVHKGIGLLLPTYDQWMWNKIVPMSDKVILKGPKKDVFQVGEYGNLVISNGLEDRPIADLICPEQKELWGLRVDEHGRCEIERNIVVGDTYREQKVTGVMDPDKAKLVRKGVGLMSQLDPTSGDTPNVSAKIDILEDKEGPEVGRISGQPVHQALGRMDVAIERPGDTSTNLVFSQLEMKGMNIETKVSKKG